MTAQHLHPTAGQQYTQELLDSPVTARALQQPPKAPRRRLPPSYSAAPHPHCQAIPREAQRQSGGCTRSEVSNQDQLQSVNPGSGLLHLLANSSPISSPEELLARLRAAGTAGAATATPTAAYMEAWCDSDRLIGSTPTWDATSYTHDEALQAPAQLYRSLLAPVVSGSSHPLSQGSWTPALQQNTDAWQQQQQDTHVWGAPAMGHCNLGSQVHHGFTWVDSYEGSHGYGDVGDAARAAQAGPQHDKSPSRPSLSLHVQTSPFAAWSAPDDWDSSRGRSIHQRAATPSCCVSEAGLFAVQGSPESSVNPGQDKLAVATMSCSPSLSPDQRQPLFLSSFDLLSSPPSSLLPFYAEQEPAMHPQPPACMHADHDILTETGITDMLWS